jgi:hypothetical protein
MSKKNATIACKVSTKSRLPLAAPKAIGRTAAAFFLNFDSDTVEAYLNQCGINCLERGSSRNHARCESVAA